MTDAPRDGEQQPTSPVPPEQAGPSVNLDKPGTEAPHSTPDEPAPPLDFDPYRFGRPEHPVPPEYAPPGYVPPPEAAPPAPAAQWPPSASGPGAYPPPYTGYPPRYGQPPGYGPYQGGPYQGGPYQGGPQQGGPYQGGQYHSGQYQGGPPPPPGYQYGAVRTGNTKATIAMVLGIGAIVFFWTSFLDLVLVVPAIVLGAIALADAKRLPQRGGRNAAIAGIACGLVAAVFAASFTVWVYVRAKDCFDNYDYHSSAFNTCIQHKL